MPDLLANCDSCGRLYNTSKLKRCPGCAAAGKSETQTYSKASQKSSEIAMSSSGFASQISNEALQQLISETAANRRETAGISRLFRAFLSFIFFNVVFSTVAVALYVIAIYTSRYGEFNFFLAGAAIVLELVGFIVAISALGSALFG